MSLLNFNFSIIYITYKMLVLLKNHLNYLKDSIFKCFLKKYDRFLFIYLFIYLFSFFSQHIMMESLRLEKQNIIKDIRSLFRLKTKK